MTCAGFNELLPASKARGTSLHSWGLPHECLSSSVWDEVGDGFVSSTNKAYCSTRSIIIAEGDCCISQGSRRCAALINTGQGSVLTTVT